MLPVTEAWFEDIETQRWLGGIEWPKIALRMAAEYPNEHTECEVAGRFVFLAWNEEKPVGLVDTEQYKDGTAGLALVIDPSKRRRGLGSEIIQAVARRPEIARTRKLRVGIEPDNRAGVRCFERAGFMPEPEEPDEEGFVYFMRRVQQ